MFLKILIVFLFFVASKTVFAADKANTSAPKSPDSLASKEKSAVDLEVTPLAISKPINASQIRIFHEVLDDILAEFSFDIKAKSLNSLKNLAIHKIVLSDSLPKTYEKYLELLLIEQIRDQSKIKLVSCLPCKTKTTRVLDDKLLITSPTTNLEELNRTAEELDIENFMDVLLLYHSSHVVLAVQVFDSKTKEVIWAQSYNSETIRTRFQKLAVDFSQIQQARISDEYRPDFRYMLGLGAGSIPNIKKIAWEKNMLSLHLRVTEKFANRHNEFGILTTFNIASSSLLKTYPAEGTPPEPDDPELIYERLPTPFTKALGIFGIYSFNFLGSLESYNSVRYGVNLAAGIHLATGYLAPTFRFGIDSYFGRRFAVNLGFMFVGEANILLDGNFVTLLPGTGGDLVLSYNM